MNCVVVSGHMVKNPETGRTKAGVPVTNFVVAVPRPGSADIVDFHDCAAWDGMASVAAGYQKGDYVEVVGTLISKSVEKDGSKRRFTEIRVTYIGSGEGKYSE